MSLEATAQKAAQRIDDALDDYDLSDQQKADILKIIGKSLVRAADELTEVHREATVVCCGHEADLAHKIEEEVERKKTALIANLMALR